MKKGFVSLVAMLLICMLAKCQQPAAASPTAPPRLLLLVHQAFLSGKDGARQKLDVAMSRACEKLNLPNAWIDLEAITGTAERLSFDPFESFEDIDNAATEWPKIYAGNRELGRIQGEIQALIASERAIIAVRRDDVGYRAGTIDLSQARVMRTLEVRVHPGREKEFVDAFQVLAAAYEKTNSDLPWVVYQVNAGMPSPTFIIFVPMRNLRQNDDLLSRREAIQAAEGESGFEQMQQIARDAYDRVESNIYAVRPEMSHVSKGFAAENPEFWLPQTASEPAKPDAKKGATKEPAEKQP
jgi:hypothetical protein